MYKYKIEVCLHNGEKHTHYASTFGGDDDGLIFDEHHKTFRYNLRYIVGVSTIPKAEVDAEQNQLALASIEREQQIQLEIADMENQIKGDE